MFGDNLVTFVEVCKAPDKHGANVYLWAVDKPRAYATALADVRRATTNLYARRTFEFHDRGKAIIGDEFDDPENIDAAHTQMSTTDKSKLKVFKQHVDRIDRAILHLDTCAEIFEEAHDA